MKHYSERFYLDIQVGKRRPTRDGWKTSTRVYQSEDGYFLAGVSRGQFNKSTTRVFKLGTGGTRRCPCSRLSGEAERDAIVCF